MQRLLPQETIRAKRDGAALTAAQIADFVHGLTAPEDGGRAGRWSDAQVAALAMAIVLRGMDTAETVALTEAMTASGTVLPWPPGDWPGPVLDKHSTGGVGDKVSLVLAPVLAACGAIVPMVSGRGLGHTGGTLDKLEALPGYRCDVDRATLHRVLRTAGCAIVGAGGELAPADRRLYALRDVTATVESVPLITASILSKKRAAGLQALVMDVKLGNGAFSPDLGAAQALAHSLVQTARGAGLPTVALITDMGQVLGRSAGNALEVAESLQVLRGDAAARTDPALQRLRTLTLALAGEALHLGGLQPTPEAGTAAAAAALDGGRAAEHFARMVAALGGPADVLKLGRPDDVLTSGGLPTAPVQRPVPAPRAGFVGAPEVRALGLAVVALGGGRSRPGQAIDPRVGLAAVRAPGEAVQAGEALAWVHAADGASADAAARAVLAAMPVQDTAPPTRPLVVQTLR